MSSALASLASALDLGSVLHSLREDHGGYELLDHWQQGEFHHDVVVRVLERRGLPGDVLVVATNCNGGLKELLSFEHTPDRWALWHMRCPDNDAFGGTLAPVLDRAVTVHWFDPCALLAADARSELREEHRSRARGGGWCKKP